MLLQGCPHEALLVNKITISTILGDLQLSLSAWLPPQGGQADDGKRNEVSGPLYLGLLLGKKS